MDDKKFSLSGSFQKTKEYLDTQLELIKLKVIAKGSRLIGAIVLDITKLVLCLVIVFFLSLALGFFLGELLHSNALGFLATAGIFMLLLVIIRAIEPKLEAKFMDLSIKKILHKLSDDEAELNSQDAKASDADTSVHNHNHNPNPTPEAAKENTAP